MITTRLCTSPALICRAKRMMARRPKRSVSFRKDLDLAALAVADAFSADTVSFAKVEMYHPAIRRGHGFQGDAAPGLDNPAGHPFRHFPQGVLPASAVLFNVEEDPNVLFELLSHDALYNELQRLQGVAPAPNEKSGVGALNVNDGPAGHFIVLRAEGNVNFGSDDVQDAFDGLDRETCRRFRGRARRGYRFDPGNLRFDRWLVLSIVVEIRVVFRNLAGDPGDPDFGQLAADAEETLTAPI